MKNILLIISASYLLTACNNNADKEGTDTSKTEVIKKYSWEAMLNDSTSKLEMKKMENKGPDTLNAPAVLTFLNGKNATVKLEFVKISADTVYLSIPAATYLTQQMGSTGPTIYFANVVFNLTEIPGIKYVNFDFEEGDHASPATYSRESFKDE